MIDSERAPRPRGAWYKQVRYFIIWQFFDLKY